jgi:hypothetical protein
MSGRKKKEGSMETGVGETTIESKKGSGSARKSSRSGVIPSSVTSISEITKKQKESLIETIQEANQNELKRQELLSKAITQQRVEELRRRHEKERSYDQQKIKNLVQDLESLQNISPGEQQRYLLNRSKSFSSGAGGGLSTMNAQRMPGEESHHFFKEEYDKFHSIDRRAANKVERFDEYAEKRKVCPVSLPLFYPSMNSSSPPLFVCPCLQLNLLKQKRDVLHKLVTIQRTTLEAALPSTASHHLPRLPAPSQSRQWDNASVVSSRSNSSRSSSASYASFNPPPPSYYKPPRLAIPPLQL